MADTMEFELIRRKERESSVSILKPGKQAQLISFLCGVFLAGNMFVASDIRAALPESIKAVYLPSHCFTERRINEFIHYAKLTGLNAAVLHVKDPHGWIRWKSKNQLALKMGAVASNGLVAWKTEDFGVGQKIEAIAPNVDVICPMFYPSHFPTGFLGRQNPGIKIGRLTPP
ncbi:hypothetical protein N9219_05530 [bacterium]|nr:hypothetical protein [bacterium]